MQMSRWGGPEIETQGLLEDVTPNSKKVLFVCRYNVGRSQWAEGIFRRLYPKVLSEVWSADSAGTEVDEELEGQTLEERATFTQGAKYMLEYARYKAGLDLSNKRQLQVTECMASRYGRVVVMADKPTVPSFLRERLGMDDNGVVHERQGDGKSAYWEIPDPKDYGRETTYMTYNNVGQLVLGLIDDIRRTRND